MHKRAVPTGAARLFMEQLMTIIRRLPPLLLFLCLAGCLTHRIPPEREAQTRVFGIQLHSDRDFREINGVAGVEEPCLHGYERTFDALDITISYGFNRRIRKITTMNRATDIFSITPGMTAAEGATLARRTGLTEVSPVRFRNDEVSLFLHTDEKGKVFGITLEAVE